MVWHPEEQDHHGAAGRVHRARLPGAAAGADVAVEQEPANDHIVVLVCRHDGRIIKRISDRTRYVGNLGPPMLSDAGLSSLPAAPPGGNANPGDGRGCCQTPRSSHRAPCDETRRRENWSPKLPVSGDGRPISDPPDLVAAVTATRLAVDVPVGNPVGLVLAQIAGKVSAFVPDGTLEIVQVM